MKKQKYRSKMLTIAGNSALIAILCSSKIIKLNKMKEGTPKIANRVYNKCFSKPDRDIVSKLGPIWYCNMPSIRVSVVRSEPRFLNCRGYNNTKYRELTLVFGVNKIFPKGTNRFNIFYTSKPNSEELPVDASLVKLVRDIDNLTIEIDEIKKKIMSTLKCATTTRALLEYWPEVEPALVQAYQLSRVDVAIRVTKPKILAPKNNLKELSVQLGLCK